MAIRVACPACQTPYEMEDAFGGKQVVCAQCNQRFQIGAAPPPPPPTVQLADQEDEGSFATPRKKKIPTGAWVALGATFFVVIGVILFVLFYLIGALGEDPKTRQAGASRPAPLRQPTMDDALGALVADPQAQEEATYKNPPLREGLAGFYDFAMNAPAPRETAGSQASPKNLERMASDVLRRVKRGTVFIRVERNEEGEGGTGSGFFCFEKDMVVTNAHVVGMMNPSAPEPKRIEIIVHSNERDELRLRGKVWCVDRKMDLALLRVQPTDKLPDPLPLVSADTLELTQNVYVIGFPFGESLGKDVTISPTSISSLRRNKGVLNELQVSGGMNPGNSGGPVVDALGRVIGIAVRARIEEGEGAQVKNTGINFAVPSDYAYYLARGTVSRLTLYPPQQDGGALRLPVSAALYDPMRRIRRVFAECWTGPAGADRNGGDTPPPKHPGDSERVSHPLPVGEIAVQSLNLPPCPDGQVYWIQLRLEGAADKRWTSAHSFKAAPGQAMQRVALRPRPVQPAAWRSDWSSTFHGHLSKSGSQLDLDVDLQNQWNEAGQGARQQTKFNLGYRLANTAPPHRVGLGLLVTRHGGRVPDTEDDNQQLTEVGKFYQKAMQESLQRAWDGLVPVLPDRPLQPMESWQNTQDFPLDCLLLLSQAPQMKFKYTYLGQNTHLGRPHAVVAVEGGRVGSNDNSTSANVHGMALVDLASRKTTFLYAALNAETDGVISLGESSLSGPAGVSGLFEFRMTRTLAGANN